MTSPLVHVNTEGERIAIERVTDGPFAGRQVLVLYDDPPPNGTGQRAPMLLDEGTRRWLLDALAEPTKPEVPDWRAELVLPTCDPVDGVRHSIDPTRCPGNCFRCPGCPRCSPEETTDG